MEKIVLNHIRKKYPDAPSYTVEDFDITIHDNEFIVFVGPSGCGKSTTLRMIAGLEDITDGDLIINGKRMNDVAPKDRGISMVFQNYSLYPHLSVYDNIGFGLKIRKADPAEMDKKIRNAADMLDLSTQLEKKPSQLSGGQRQRVALGRAIVRESDIMLMDEPLSNLDAKLRVSMRKEIVELQRKLGSTVIYVTHDQTEAMTMATRIVCMNDGIIQQVGTPKDLYEDPANLFVAGFLGAPGMNFYKGTVKDGNFYLQSGAKVSEGLNIPDQEDVTMGIRPENMGLHKNGEGMPFHVDLVELLGSDYHVHGTLDGNKTTLRIPSKEIDGIYEDTIYVKTDPKYKQYFDKNGVRIYQGNEIYRAGRDSHKEVSVINNINNNTNNDIDNADGTETIVIESR